jgi:ribosomal-protein-alanine N-acetyltransferase
VHNPLLATLRTSLCPLSSTDVALTHALWTDAGVRKYLWDDVVIAYEKAAEVVADSADHFARHGYGLWSVRETASGELLGVCGFRPSAAGEPELLFALWPQYWGQGYAIEVARAVIAYVFEVLGRAHVVAATDVTNAASVRTLQRLGMQLERREKWNGVDTYFYRLTRDVG